jgi:1-acyl-sn-glycerol-3-phosphate acyltransferase
VDAVPRPTPAQLALLDRFERIAFRFAHRVNSNRVTKRASHWFTRNVGMGWVHPSVRHLLHVEGTDALRALRPDRGVLVCANHRSFFDLYVVTCALFRDTDLARRIYFPVRAEFFYETPLGMIVNGLMSAWSMYPPILRQPERSEFNKYTMGELVSVLQEPGTVVGFHPEGTRGQGDDPYTLLPAQPGVGQLILQAKPIVIPVFIHGLSNDLVAQVRSNYRRSGQRVILIFGEPMNLERFYAQTIRLRTSLDTAKAVHAAIAALGDRERALRERLGDRVVG